MAKNNFKEEYDVDEKDYGTVLNLDVIDIGYMNTPHKYLAEIRRNAERARNVLIGIAEDNNARNMDRISAAKKLIDIAGNNDGGLLGVSKADIEDLGRKELTRIVRDIQEEIGKKKKELKDAGVIDMSSFGEN